MPRAHLQRAKTCRGYPVQEAACDSHLLQSDASSLLCSSHCHWSAGTATSPLISGLQVNLVQAERRSYGVSSCCNCTAGLQRGCLRQASRASMDSLLRKPTGAARSTFSRETWAGCVDICIKINILVPLC